MTRKKWTSRNDKGKKKRERNYIKRMEKKMKGKANAGKENSVGKTAKEARW